jgi:ribosomal-protein-alanine N-acetyltransferase
VGASSVSRAGLAFAPALAAIHARAVGDAAWSAASVAAQLQLPGVFALRHGADGMLIARLAADEAEILVLAVVPWARRHGIGTALLRGAIAETRSRGAAALYLEVSARNEAALRLYCRAGFVQVAVRRDYYSPGDNALVLRLALTVPDAAGSR